MPDSESLAITSEPASLARRIGEGDRHAEEQLVAKYQRPILELLRHRTRDQELAQDLLQDTFIIIIRKLRNEGIADPDRLPAYMHRVAHNLVIAHFRKDARQNTQADSEKIEVLQDNRPSAQEVHLRLEQDQLVASLLDDLTQSRDREILLRFYVWNQEKHFVCDAMALSADQFDRVVSRARQRFREIVEERAVDWR